MTLARLCAIAIRLFVIGLPVVAHGREQYLHGGAHNFNPHTVHGPYALDTEDKEKFLKDLSAFRNPEARSENYEYQTNRDDILARHTFVLAGEERRLGHHVAFFESRHQHQAVVRLDFDFTGAGVSLGSRIADDLKAGKALFENRILKNGLPALAKGEYYAVQVSPLNPEFALVTLPTNITRIFVGSFAKINEQGKVTRFNPSGADVIVNVVGIEHFNRMYTDESSRDLQYLSYPSSIVRATNKFVLVHVIQGSMPGQTSKDALNTEQMVEAELIGPAGAPLKEGATLTFAGPFAGRSVDTLLQPGDVAEARTDDAAFTAVKMKIERVLYNRPVGIDPTQEAVRRRVRGQ